MLKALMAKPQFERAQRFTPLAGARTSRNDAKPRLDPTHFAISAALSGEEDFELGGEFLEVFIRAGERVGGFIAGCMLIAGIWFLWSAL